jgi:hypothetical protein
MTPFRSLAAALLAGATILSATAPSFARSKGDHARFSDAMINTGAPALQTTVDMIAAGNGATAPGGTTTSFDAVKLFGALAGSLTKPELDKLTKEYGADGVATFVKTFNFVVDDATKQVLAAGVKLPATSNPLPDGKSLSKSLYTLGVMPNGKFDVEYMLDALVTHPIHVQVMNDIDADKELGPKADRAYHVVLTEIMGDLKAGYGL